MDEAGLVVAGRVGLSYSVGTSLPEGLGVAGGAPGSSSAAPACQQSCAEMGLRC